jgi:DNA-binding NarL/FixJ family response regulator
MTPGAADAPLRIVIADDQASVREGLVLLLGRLPGIEVVCAAADGEQALDLVAEHQPDVILLDLHMPVLDGIGATRRLAAEHPGVAVVVSPPTPTTVPFSTPCTPGRAVTSPKDADHVDIAQALRAAASGLTVFDPPRARHPARRHGGPGRAEASGAATSRAGASRGRATARRPHRA